MCSLLALHLGSEVSSPLVCFKKHPVLGTENVWAENLCPDFLVPNLGAEMEIIVTSPPWYPGKLASTLSQETPLLRSCWGDKHLGWRGWKRAASLQWGLGSSLGVTRRQNLLSAGWGGQGNSLSRLMDGTGWEHSTALEVIPD